MHPFQKIALDFISFIFRLPMENPSASVPPRRTGNDREWLEICLAATYKPQYPIKKRVPIDCGETPDADKTGKR